MRLHRQPLQARHQGDDHEPVAWQYRMRPDWGSKKDCWGPWQDCTLEQVAMYRRVPLLHDWAYESRTLYTAPQPVIPQLDSVVKALTDYCNTGEIDCADDLLAGVLYATDLEQQPALQPLTIRQMADAGLHDLIRSGSLIELVRAVERMHHIK